MPVLRRGFVPMRLKIVARRYIATLSRLRGDGAVPPRSLQRISGATTEQAYDVGGKRFVRDFVELGGLQPEHDVLDVGCGAGRMAVALTPYLTTGSYVGIDVVAESIRWCERNIAAHHPNFRFEVADVRNDVYNPRGSMTPDSYRFPFSDAAFDMTIACSLYTHLLRPQVANYVRESARVLRPGGTFFGTFFVIDDEVHARQAAGAGRLAMTVIDDGVYAAHPEEPEAAIGYDASWLMQVIDDAGLQPGPIRRGNWSGVEGATSLQDVVIARKT